MMRGWRLLAVLCLAAAAATASCVIPDPVVPRPEIVRIVESEGDKVMTVVRNARLADHEPGAVTKQAVTSAMLASGFFQEEDAKYLAGPIALEMPRMASREQVRIVGWADDGPRIYYVLIHGGKLRLAYYKGAEELDRHEAVIPTEAVPMGGAIPPSPPEPPPAVTPEGPTYVVSTAAAAAPPAPVARAPSRPAPARPALPPLSEDEARKKLQALDEMLGKNLITPDEYKRGKREILVRL
jgi:hypothetical protein